MEGNNKNNYTDNQWKLFMMMMMMMTI